MSSAINVMRRSALAFLALGLAQAAFAVDALPSARFVGFAQEADDFQIGAARIALQKSGNEAIRGFANRMIFPRLVVRESVAASPS